MEALTSIHIPVDAETAKKVGNLAENDCVTVFLPKKLYSMSMDVIENSNLEEDIFDNVITILLSAATIAVAKYMRDSKITDHKEDVLVEKLLNLFHIKQGKKTIKLTKKYEDIFLVLSMGNVGVLEKCFDPFLNHYTETPEDFTYVLDLINIENIV